MKGGVVMGMLTATLAAGDRVRVKVTARVKLRHSRPYPAELGTSELYLEPNFSPYLNVFCSHPVFLLRSLALTLA